MVAAARYCSLTPCRFLDAACLLTVGSFLLTVELFFLTVDNFSYFAYSWSFFAYNGKVRLIRALRDCKQSSLTVSKKAPTVSKKASTPSPNTRENECRNLSRNRGDSNRCNFKFGALRKGPPFHGSRSSREMKIQNASCQMGGRKVTR